MSYQAPPSRRDPELDKLYDAASFYRACCLVLVCVVVVETGFLIWHSRHNRFARAIRINDQVVCFVRNERTAEVVRSRLLDEQKGKLPGQGFIEQKWESLNWPLAEGSKVIPVEEAVKVLKPRVTVKVGAAAIRLGQRDLVVLPDKQTAQMAVDLLKQQYSGGSGKLIKVELLQKDVVIADVKAPPKSVATDVHEAVKQLGAPADSTEDYTVQPGDSWRKIAGAHKTTISKLRALNPNYGSILHRKDVIKVPGPSGVLTVVTEKEETREEVVNAPEERVPTETLTKGVTRVTIQGTPGKKLITEHVIYHNGQAVSRRQTGSVVMQQPVPRRVMVGTG